MINGINKSERGAVSLFVVVFTALLVTIVTISFVQVMLRNQQEATVADISQSAYDSALAGVEDAKRVLASNSSFKGTECNSVKRALDPTVKATNMSETKIQQTDGANGFEQAYTCVKVDPNPKDLLVDLGKDKSTLLPLKTVGGARFDTIKLTWRLRESDSGTATTATFPSVPAPNVPPKLPRGGTEWASTVPALLRSQLIQYDGQINLDQFDSTSEGPSDFARTKFLYPFRTAPPVAEFTNDISPTPAECRVDGGVCSIKLRASNGNYKDNVFLRLTSLYNDARVQIQVSNSADPTQVIRFADVQAAVDSTGRASNAFRRVSARVNLKSNDSFPYPEAALDLGGNLCKNFGVTNAPEDYSSGVECKPEQNVEENNE